MFVTNFHILTLKIMSQSNFSPTLTLETAVEMLNKTLTRTVITRNLQKLDCQRKRR